MKFAIVFALFTIATAAVLPGSPESLATVEYQESQIASDHSHYSHAVKTSNGITHQEQGTLVQARSLDESPAYSVQGEYSWVAADGQVYLVRYTAGPNGFQPEGNHLPVAPVA